jgi:hypothetical protein
MMYGMIDRLKGIQLFCVNLCSWGDSGDWEVFPAEELNLQLSSIVSIISDRGWKVAASNESVVLAESGERKITLFCSGRIIIEQVRPDNRDTALRIALEVLS